MKYDNNIMMNNDTCNVIQNPLPIDTNMRPLQNQMLLQLPSAKNILTINDVTNPGYAKIVWQHLDISDIRYVKDSSHKYFNSATLRHIILYRN